MWLEAAASVASPGEGMRSVHADDSRSPSQWCRRHQHDAAPAEASGRLTKMSVSWVPHPEGTGPTNKEYWACRLLAGTKAESSEGIGSSALGLAWHPNGTRLGVSRKNGKFSIYDTRKMGVKPKAVCEKTLPWELNQFLFCGSGDRIVASYGHHSRGGYKVLKVCAPPKRAMSRARMTGLCHPVIICCVRVSCSVAC